MLNKEVVEEIFIEAPHRDSEGKLCGIPAAASFIMAGFGEWYWQEFPKGQYPRISAGPKILPNGAEGFSIRREIVHK